MCSFALISFNRGNKTVTRPNTGQRAPWRKGITDFLSVCFFSYFLFCFKHYVFKHDLYLLHFGNQIPYNSICFLSYEVLFCFLYILILPFQAHSKALNIFLPKKMFEELKTKGLNSSCFLWKSNQREEITVGFPEGTCRDGERCTENTREVNRRNIL